MAHIKTKLYCNWSSDIKRRLCSLTLKYDSGMRRAVYVNPKVKTFVMFENTVPVAWALLDWDNFNKEYDIMIYTSKNKRKHGYGRRLYSAAKKWAGTRPTFVYDDNYNRGFFIKIGAVCYE